MSDTTVSRPSRRTLLARLVASTMVVQAFGGLACRGRPASDRPPGPHASLALSGIPDEGRVEVDVDGNPVEVRRSGHTLEARSLLCPHMGCKVTWVDVDQRYHCPCHGGRFDREGRVLEGAPTRSLYPAPVCLDGDVVTVYNAKVAPEGHAGL
jgi:nitrite reductase/ring-hydroxylating ferredoxin subunit